MSLSSQQSKEDDVTTQEKQQILLQQAECKIASSDEDSCAFGVPLDLKDYFTPAERSYVSGDEFGVQVDFEMTSDKDDNSKAV